MPSLTTTIEDVSPLIIYAGEWRPGTSADSLANKYSQSSFTVSESDGASATFRFNGTGVQIFGAKRQNHGFYQVNVDGNTLPPISGSVPDPGKFQDTLFSTTTLQQGLHNVTLINNGKSFVDIDFITWQTNIGSTDEQLSVKTVQDTDASFAYEPSSSWTTNPKNIGMFFGGSGHVTSTAGSSLVYTFERAGDGVSLYGPVGPEGSPYSVQLDGGLSANYSSNKQFYTPQVLLYHADNLGPGRHNLKLLYLPTSSGQVFAIDYANVYMTPSRSGSSATSSGRSLAGGTVAGIVITILVVLTVVAGLFLFLRRRKARRVALVTMDSKNTIEPRSNYPGILATPGMPRETFGTSINTTVPVAVSFPSTDSVTSDASLLGNQTKISRNPILGTQLPSSTTEPLEYSSLNNAPNPGGSSLVTKANSTSPKAQIPARLGKGAPLRLPPAASQSLAQVPEVGLRAKRMGVDGRPQDFGAIPVARGGVAPPPPDYLQATERYNGEGF